MNLTSKHTTRLIAAAALGSSIAVLAGCGALPRVDLNAKANNPAKGKSLFIKSCGSCHAFADAETTGTVGPNLDDAFASVKAQGFDQTTIVDVIRGQISLPDTNPGTGFPGMPADLLRGQDARDVAIYVAKCAENESCGVTAAPVDG